MRASIVLLSLAACAAPTTPPPEPGEGAPVEHRVLVPNVLPAAPERPFIDLGPILVRTEQHAADPNELLLAEADRLGADAFILEGRAIQEVYAGGASGERHGARKVAALVIASLLSGGIVFQTADGSPDREFEGFYRAIRYTDGDGAAIDVSTLDVSHRARERLATAASLRAQYDLALDMLLDGELATGDYERIRRRLAGT